MQFQLRRKFFKEFAIALSLIHTCTTTVHENLVSLKRTLAKETSQEVRKNNFLNCSSFLIKKQICLFEI